MSRLGSFLALAVVAAGAGAGGYWTGQRNLSGLAVIQTVEEWFFDIPVKAEPLSKLVTQTSSGPVIYYRHPDGDAAYSATPKSTDDGRNYVAVLASEDVSFDDPAQDTTSQAVAEGKDSGDRKVLYYRNPMGLPDTSPVPKKDAMGMDYLPVYEGEANDGSTVNISAGKLQRSGVRTVLAARSAVTRPVKVPGMVTLDERRVSVVSTRTEAFVEEVADITTGEAIGKGRPLVRLYAKEIAAAGALYAADLKGGADGAAAAGSRQRLENLGVPPGTIAEIEKTRKAPISMTLTAPRDGLVLERSAVEGMMAEAGKTLFRIADVSAMWVVADVPEYDVNAIREGDRAVVRVRSLTGKEFVGKVVLIYPEIQTQTRTGQIRIELTNPDGLLRSNMYAEVEVETGAAEPVVTVPDSAIIDTGDRQFVIVDKGEGRFEARAVKVGMRGEDVTGIMEGIAEGREGGRLGEFPDRRRKQP